MVWRAGFRYRKARHLTRGDLTEYRHLTHARSFPIGRSSHSGARGRAARREQLQLQKDPSKYIAKGYKAETATSEGEQWNGWSKKRSYAGKGMFIRQPSDETWISKDRDIGPAWQRKKRGE